MYYDTKEDTYQTTSDCGNTIVYSLNVRNYGSDDATGVITKFTLGNGYEFIGYSIESVDTTQTNYVTYDNATRTLTWYIRIHAQKWYELPQNNRQSNRNNRHIKPHMHRNPTQRRPTRHHWTIPQNSKLLNNHPHKCRH